MDQCSNPAREGMCVLLLVCLSSRTRQVVCMVRNEVQPIVMVNGKKKGECKHGECMYRNEKKKYVKARTRHVRSFAHF